MKILCLHGKGTSASILKTQTASFRKHLHTLSPETSLVFDFIDGPLASAPAPAIDKFFSGPYYSFYSCASTDDLRSAHLWLLEVIKTQGPYDGVLAFSQGCALIATLMLDIQSTSAKSPDKERWRPKQPFKFAIFICGGIPLGYLEEKGYEVDEEARIYDGCARLALAAQASFDALLASGTQRWTLPPLNSSNNHSTVFGLDTAQISPTHNFQIPTVHIYGTRDPRMGSALQLAGMCRSDRSKVVGHRGGHEIPRTKEVSEVIAGLVLWAMEEGRSER